MGLTRDCTSLSHCQTPVGQRTDATMQGRVVLHCPNLAANRPFNPLLGVVLSSTQHTHHSSASESRHTCN